MASVTLDRAFLSEASNPANYIGFFTADRSDVRATSGEVRRYANGRLRLVTRTGSTTVLELTARLLTPGQVATVDAWRGVPVLFRDVQGRRMFGAYIEVDVKDYADRGGQDVTITLTEVSYSEAV